MGCELRVRTGWARVEKVHPNRNKKAFPRLLTFRLMHHNKANLSAPSSCIGSTDRQHAAVFTHSTTGDLLRNFFVLDSTIQNFFSRIS